MLTKAATLLLFFLSYPAWTASWFFAPATASQAPEAAETLSFHSLENYEDLDGLLIDNEGLFWFRTRIYIEAGNDSLLLTGSELGWEIWLVGEKPVSSGSGPPWWYPSTEIPQLVKLAPGTEGDLVLLMKSYIRRGYTSVPAEIVQGTESELRRRQLISALQSPGIPAMAVLLGILLFIGGLSAAAIRTQSSDVNFALFGFFVAILSIEPVLASIPGLPPMIPWLVLAVTTRAALPFALCFWRKAIACNRTKGHVILNVLDILLASLISLWLIVPVLGVPLVPHQFAGFFGFDILPWYLLLNAGAAFSFWVYQISVDRNGRIGSLLIFLSAIIPVFIGYKISGSFAQWEDMIVMWGLPVSLVVTLPVFMSRGKFHRAVVNAEDDPEELEELEDLIEPSIANHRAESPEKDSLARSIRSSLFPDSIPWDPVWDLASARQGASHPATGFHDIYLADKEALSGFSFMDAGSESLESLIFAHLVKSELTSSFKPGNSLPGIARTVHRKVIGAAGAAEKAMKGVVGRFMDDKLVFLPLSTPPLMMRQRSSGRVISLVPVDGKTNNAPLGSRQFGTQGLRTMNVTMKTGDVVVIYTPSILKITSPAGEQMGMGRFAGALKASRGRKADEIVADIVGGIKDFSGSDTIPFPLQILVIHKR